jgi:HEAT repeat protein
MVDPTPEIRTMPTELLGGLVDQLNDDEWGAGDRLRVLHLLSRDPRAEVRARVAEKAYTLWNGGPTDAVQLLRTLSRDGSAQVRRAAAAGLESLLRNAMPVDRVALIAEWATSDVVEERVAIAAVLRGDIPCFINDLVVGQFAEDPNDTVRRLATEALARHVDEHPEMYAQAAMRLASDPIRAIRRTARRALKRLRLDHRGGM